MEHIDTTRRHQLTIFQDENTRSWAQLRFGELSTSLFTDFGVHCMQLVAISCKQSVEQASFWTSCFCLKVCQDRWWTSFSRQTFTISCDSSLPSFIVVDLHWQIQLVTVYDAAQLLMIIDVVWWEIADQATSRSGHSPHWLSRRRDYWWDVPRLLRE